MRGWIGLAQRQWRWAGLWGVTNLLNIKASQWGWGRPSLVWPKNCDRGAVKRTADATILVRDLINIPAEDMGPPELALAARKLAKKHDARINMVIGNALFKEEISNDPCCWPCGKQGATF